MQFVQIKDKTLQQLLCSDCNLWIVDKMPAPILSSVTMDIEVEENDGIDEIFRKIIAYFDIEPHREHSKRSLQLEKLLHQNAGRVLVLFNAHLMNEKVNFRKFVLLSEKLAGVFLQGNVFSLGVLAQSEVSFVSRGMVGIHADLI